MALDSRTSPTLAYVAAAAVVASFLAATAWTESRSDQIRSAALSIALDATPSIQNLSAIQTQLWRLELFVDRYSRGTAEPAELREVEDARSRLSQHLDAYSHLPMYPNEEEMARQLDDLLRKVDEAAGHAVEEVQEGDAPAAGFLIRGELHDLVLSAQALSSDDLEVNTRNAHDAADRIEAVRARSKLAAYVLDGVSVVLALVWAVVAGGQLRQAYRLQERRTAELERFAGRVAHDILSPLNAVALSLDLADRLPAGDARARDALARGKSALGRVRGITDGLLEFARAGARPVPEAHASLRAVVDELSEELRPFAREQRADLVVEPFEDGEVATTPAVLASVLQNLVRNALKYLGDARERRVTVRVRPTVANLCVEVEDTGPGIPEDQQSTLFEPYARAPGVTEPGLGLGLATVKSLVEAYGGRVGLRSVAGQGARFWVVLPRAPASTVARGAA